VSPGVAGQVVAVDPQNVEDGVGDHDEPSPCSTLATMSGKCGTPSRKAMTSPSRTSSAGNAASSAPQLSVRVAGCRRAADSRQSVWVSLTAVVSHIAVSELAG
jgi:hypothetical protein